MMHTDTWGVFDVQAKNKLIIFQQKAADHTLFVFEKDYDNNVCQWDTNSIPEEK